MKILLLGEYSGLHLTLAQGLRVLGHDVTVASDGDGFKNYVRDIDLRRKSSGLLDTVSNLSTVLHNFRKFKGYDIVQIINPDFTNLNTRINLRLYRFLKKHNKKVFLGAFGDDYFWLKACLDQKFKYSEFYIDGKRNYLEENERLQSKWLGTIRQKANVEIAQTSDGIIACLYEYYIAYQDTYKDKLSYIPLPINTDVILPLDILSTNKLNFFIGVNKARNEFKGTNILEEALILLNQNYPDDVNIIKAESVDFAHYLKLVNDSHVVLDQIYSYSPAMNGLLTLALQKVLVGGGEPEMYDLMGEYKNRPIVNVFPSFDDIYIKLESLLLNRDTIEQRSGDGRKFVEDHHNYIRVAQQYLDFWSSK
jgi:hypothetical protein